MSDLPDGRDPDGMTPHEAFEAGRVYGLRMLMGWVRSLSADDSRALGLDDEEAPKRLAIRLQEFEDGQGEP